MPIYEYQCRACGHRFDALQKVSDAPLRDCPVCAKQELKKLVSAPSFRLRGSGWYETDFKKDNQRNLLKSDTEPAKSDKTEAKSSKDDSSKGDKQAKASTESKKTSDKKSGGKVDSD